MEDDRGLNEYIARQQNLVDHLVRQVYGEDIKFEDLSAFGQFKIEAMAREMADDVRPDLVKEGAMQLQRQEIARLRQALSQALSENRDLWESNEQLQLELYDLGEADAGA